MAQKNKVTDWVRLAVEGATTDGRNIERDWLTGAAASYSPDVYGARIDCEHIKGYAPMTDPQVSPFGSYGDVVELKAEEITDGPLKGKMALYGKLSPTDELVALNKKRQKVYSSIEIAPSFADTGTPYLLGMAVTDNPASLGTSYLQFCAQNPAASPLAARHTVEGALFTAAEQIELAFADQPQAESGSLFFSKIAAMLFSGNRRQAQDTTDLQNAVELMATSQRDALNEIDALKAQVQVYSGVKQALDALRTDYDGLVQKLTAQPEDARERPAATGGNDNTRIDY